MTVIDEKYGLGKNQKVAVIKPTAVLQFKDHQKNPFFRNTAGLAFEDAEWYHVMTPEGPAEISKTQAQRIDQGNSTTPRQLIEMAEQFLDLPYVWSRDQQQWL